MSSHRSDPALSYWNLVPRPAQGGLFLLACLLACSLGMAARRPFILASEMQAQNERLEKQLATLKYESQKLEMRVAEFNTPEGQERDVRNRGYLKPGETRLTFLP